MTSVSWDRHVPFGGLKNVGNPEAAVGERAEVLSRTENAPLMRSQRNAIFRLVTDSALDPFSFEWREEEHPSEFGCMRDTLHYKGDGFFFRIMRRGECFAVRYAPGFSTPIDVDGSVSWTGLLCKVRDWLSFIDREVCEPDLWAQLRRSQIGEGVTVDPDGGNEPFTIAEAMQLTDGLQQVRDYLEAEFDGNDKAHALIHAELDYLAAAVERQGRRDWFHTAIGVLVSLGATISLSPEHGQHLMLLLKQAVSGLVRYLPQ